MKILAGRRHLDAMRLWSAIARAVITRRDHLILLGLATRRSPKAAEVPEPVTSIAPDATDDETDVTPGASAPA